MRSLDEWDADPELGDEDDSEYQAEMFEPYRYMGWKLEDLKDPEDQRKYAEWLKECTA